MKKIMSNLRKISFSGTIGVASGIALAALLMVQNWDFMWNKTTSGAERKMSERALTDVSSLVRPAIVEVEVIQDPIWSWNGKMDNRTFWAQFADFSADLLFITPLRMFFHHHEGLGFVTDPDGIVLTDALGVGNASLVRIKLHDDRRAPARVLGVDQHSGIAVLKVDIPNLPAVEFGRTQDVFPGKTVIIPAIIGEDVAQYRAGLVVARHIYEADASDGVTLETDLAIGSNEYGGPLLDEKGKVIGILSSLTGNSRNALAIPADIVQRVERQVIETGRACRADLGVTGGRISKRLANDVGLSEARGIYVYVVRPGGAAERAGIKREDVIVALDDRKVFGKTDLTERIQAAEPGQFLRIKVFRGGELRELYATLELAGPDQFGECNSRTEVGGAPNSVSVIAQSPGG